MSTAKSASCWGHIDIGKTHVAVVAENGGTALRNILCATSNGQGFQSLQWSVSTDPESRRAYFIRQDGVTQWEPPLHVDEGEPMVTVLSLCHHKLGNDAAVDLVKLFIGSSFRGGSYSVPEHQLPSMDILSTPNSPTVQEGEGGRVNAPAPEPAGEPAVVVHSYEAVAEGELSITTGAVVRVSASMEYSPECAHLVCSILFQLPRSLWLDALHFTRQDFPVRTAYCVH